MAAIRILAPVLFAVAVLSPAQVIDYHQHLYSPVAGPISIAGWTGVTADELIRFMDEAHISRAVVLSTAYSLANPHKTPVPNEREAVRNDNDWTSAQVARYPERLTGFCSVNPLRP
jgi:predicted TIM-barrel fold metal-dependent hydrolase